MSNNKKTNQIAEKVRLMQVPSDAVRNAQKTVVENTEGFNDVEPGNIPKEYVNGVNQLLDILGIGRVVEVDVV